MLTAGDDYPLHQRPEPIAFAGSDRNFYDRYFFHGQSSDGRTVFGAALGVYPQRNLIDAAFSLMVDGRQRSVFASRILNHDRMDIRVGPIAVAVEAPLHRLAVTLEPVGGLSARLLATGLHPPVEEPRFTHRIGSRLLMDSLRMTQNVSWSGQIDSIEGRFDVTGWQGTRDRSWGIRPLGLPDPEPAVPVQLPQFFWLWAPLHFEGWSLFAHRNDDATGRAWNRSAVAVRHADGLAHPLDDVRFALTFHPGTRRIAGASIGARMAGAAGAGGGAVTVDLVTQAAFRMAGLGYGHPQRGHGRFWGDDAVAHEQLDDDDPAALANAHVQAPVAARLRWPDGRVQQGRGILEQLLVGPHAPSGFAGLDDAP